MKVTREILRSLILEEIESTQHLKAEKDANKALKKALRKGKPLIDLVRQGKVDIPLDDGTRVTLSTDVAPLTRVKQGQPQQILADLQHQNLNVTVKRPVGGGWTATGRLVKPTNPEERGVFLKLSRRI